MTDESKNTKAIAILRQWVIVDGRGQERVVSLHKPLTKDAELVARLPRPEHWREVPIGSVPPARPAPHREYISRTAIGSEIAALETKFFAKMLPKSPKRKGGR
jgi:hypothetical protein